MRWVAPAFLSLALVVARSASASPEDILGYGPRSPSMGGTGAACSEGFEAAYTNPALLARIRRQKLTLGFEAATFDLHADGAGVPGRVSYESMRAIVIGADVPIPLRGVLTDRIGAALALSTPTNLIVRGRIPYPEQTQFPLLPDRAQSVSVRAGLGIDVGWGIRVGAGFAALAQLQGSAVVATDATGRVGSRVEDQLVATYAPTVGLSYDLPLHDGETTRIGLTFRGELAARFHVTIDATKLSSLNIPVLTIAGLAQYDPAELTLEIARTSGPLLVAVGATYKRWSAYPGLLEATAPCPGDDPTCGALTPPSIAYSDTIVPRAGADYALVAAPSLRMHLRAGALFEPTPLPSRLSSSRAYDLTAARTIDVPTRYFDTNRLALTLGYGVELSGALPPLTLDLFAQAHVLLPRTIASDAQDTPSGPVNGAGKASGTVLAVGLLAGVAF